MPETSSVAPAPRVLLVTDHPQLTGPMERMLQSEGLAVRVADAAAAADAAEQSRPGVVVILDRPPSLDGVELSRLLKADHTAPVVVISEGVESPRNGLIDQVADLRMTQPFRRNELLDAVHGSLAKAAPAPDLSPPALEAALAIKKRTEGWTGISGSWSAWRLKVRAVARLADYDLTVVRPDGTTEQGSVDDLTLGLCGKLRGVTADERGAWFTATLQADRSGGFAVTFDYDSPPEWPRPVRAGAYLEDAQMFPRDPGTVPAWLQEQLTAASEVPDPAEDLLEKVSALFGRQPDAVDELGSQERGWAWYVPATRLWHLVTYACSRPRPWVTEGFRGYGYEYTLAWPGEAGSVPDAAWTVLAVVSGFTTREGYVFGSYQSILYGGPLGIGDAPEDYQGYVLVPEPLAESVSCAEGDVRLLRILPATGAELEEMGDGQPGEVPTATEVVAARLAEADPLLIFPRWQRP